MWFYFNNYCPSTLILLRKSYSTLNLNVRINRSLLKTKTNNRKNINDIKSYKKYTNMSYCKWIVSKQLMQSYFSLNWIRNSFAHSPAVCCSRLQNIPNASDVRQTSSLSANDVNLTKRDTYLFPYTASLRCIHNYRSIDSKKLKNDLVENENGDEFGNLSKHKKNSVCVSPEKPYLTYEETISEDSVSFDPSSESADFSSKEHDRITKLFPFPKATLNNLKNILGQDVMEIFCKQEVKKKGKKGKKTKLLMGGWTATCRLIWPTTVIFEEEGLTKQLSTNKAAARAVHWLYTHKNINDEGNPIYSKEFLKEIHKDLNHPIPLEIDEHEQDMIRQLINKYSSIDIMLRSAHQKIMQQKHTTPVLPSEISTSEAEEDAEFTNNNSNIHNLKLAAEMVYLDPVFGTPPEEKNEGKMKQRNKYLQDRSENLPTELDLPILAFREKIIDTVASNRCVVICGAPGCGKSTKTPSYLLDDASKRGEGALCNLLVSQPRRVAALALASIVSQMRGEELGDVCGHQVRLSTRLTRPPGGAILFCTAGALLRRLASSPGLPGCSHLVLDEAHERSADSDAVMALAKRAMTLNPKLKVIIMSATIDTDLFSKYYDNCPVLNIPGFSYPVKSHYLEDFLPGSGLTLNRTWEASQEDNRPNIDSNEVTSVIQWVDRQKGPGAILCFLPGWQDIRKVMENLQRFSSDSRLLVVPVHSRLSNEDQRKIFSKPPSGVRKIILATNIAETSITIDDVSYVIDTGVHKEHRLMDERGISSLDNDWVSQASVAQRRGRAGRVKPGECFHLYTQRKMETFTKNNIPEILRVPLEKTVLDCKTYSEGDKAIDFLSQFPEPPTPKAIETAVKDLVELGALDQNERLTPLGRRIASFTTHPKISKALVHSTVFKVASPVIDLSTILSNNIDLFSCKVEGRSDLRKTKASYHPTSDHMAMYWLNQQYQNVIKTKGFREAAQFCKTLSIRRERINSVYDLRKISLEHLIQSRMLSEITGDRAEDQYSGVDELSKGVLLSGLNTILHTRNYLKTKGRLSKEKILIAEHGQKAFLASSSINHGVEKRPGDHMLLYCGAVHSKERRGLLIRDTSLLHPITVFLFAQNLQPKQESDESVIFEIPNKKVTLNIPKEQAKLLWNLRKIMWAVVEYYIENKGFSHNVNNSCYQLLDDDEDVEEDFRYVKKKGLFTSPKQPPKNEDSKEAKAIENFKDILVKVVADILNNAESIAEDTETKKSSLADDDL